METMQDSASIGEMLKSHVGKEEENILKQNEVSKVHIGQTWKCMTTFLGAENSGYGNSEITVQHWWNIAISKFNEYPRSLWHLLNCQLQFDSVCTL